MFRSVLACAFALGCLVPTAARPEEAVLFVTDWSNSMTGGSRDGRQLFELTPEVLESFFATAAESGRRPDVGLITFGNTGNSKSKADEANCEQDVTLRVGAGTDFAAARTAVMAEIGATRPGGFTPIFSAIDKATFHAVDLIDSGQAESVRIVVITDLKDTCDNQNGYVEITGSYCELGKLLAARVEEGRSETGGLVRLEFVVAIGGNSANLSVLAECAGASSIVVNDIDQAIEGGKEIADAEPPPPPAPETTDIQVLAVFRGAEDALGRAVPFGPGEVLFEEDGAAAAVGSAIGERITRNVGTRGRVDLSLDVGVTDGAVEVLFDGTAQVEVPWRLPRAEVELAGAGGTVAAGTALMVLRALDGSGEATIEVTGSQELSLLPGDYEIVMGFPGGTWEKRQVRIGNIRPTQTVVFTVPTGGTSVTWTAPAAEAGDLPGPLAMVAGSGSAIPVAVPFGGGQATAVPRSGGAIRIGLARDGTAVWTQEVAVGDAATSRVTVKGGLVWVTARTDRHSEWRLVDRTGGTPVTTRFQGDVFARALPPGEYTLFLNGEPVCDEGENFRLDIGKPVDFGSAPAWLQGACG